MGVLAKGLLGNLPKGLPISTLLKRLSRLLLMAAPFGVLLGVLLGTLRPDGVKLAVGVFALLSLLAMQLWAACSSG